MTNSEYMYLLTVKPLIAYLSPITCGALICFHVSFHLADPISVYHVVFICFQLLNFDINFYISMSFSSTSTGRNAGCAGESLHHPCKGFWKGLQESHQKGWPRTWLLQVVNQLFMPSPYLLLLHYLTIIIVILRLRYPIASIKAAYIFWRLVNWWSKPKQAIQQFCEPMSSVI